MARSLNLYEAKTQLSRLVDEAAVGEEIVICKHGKPKARLVPMAQQEVAKPREPGFWKVRVWYAEGWEEPPPEEIWNVLREDADDPLDGEP